MKVIDALTRDGRNARADLDGASSAGGFATEADVLRALHTGTCIPGPGAATGPGPGIRVRVHYNLHRGGFSVVSRTTGRVIGHAGDITLADVEFRVQQGTLARIRAEGRLRLRDRHGHRDQHAPRHRRPAAGDVQPVAR